MKNSQLFEFFSSRLNDYLDLLRQMVEINSFTSNSEGVNQLGDFTAQIFSAFGFQFEFIPSKNPDFGRHLFLHYQVEKQADSQPAKIPSIAMISHLDTVFSKEEEIANDFNYRPEGDRIYGPGTVDIKGGTIMILMVLNALHHLYPHIFQATQWIIGLNASEETLSKDFGSICLQRIPKDALACLVFEGGTPGENSNPLVTSRKGRAIFRVSAEGRSAHSGNYHKQGANAILQICDTLLQIADFTNYQKQITFNVGVINGGSVVNRVPQFAEALVEMRAFSPEVFAEGKNKLEGLDGGATISSYDGYPCRVSIDQLSSTAPWPHNPKTERLFNHWKETGTTIGMMITPEERGGLSDGNFLWQAYPTLDGLGPTGANAHCSERSEDGAKDQEYVLKNSIIPKAVLNTLAVKRLLDDQ
jgi:glutamate carboxypeptidase